ncbi:GNAT family N-acetyltransferase [Methylobacterium sp. J-076]|uniref:GNAT family N-acetyltransferase n=1 Tax=Methylobacterium sp. J-076 TaxID=2836655 RepID=UPI001FBB436A|nr:GNAT family N-acetyltransferase [Methylobacterium sp. J-076]MCJ2014565.1 GNAT family N-acetyltransferase [Methylobacterium sp. J-076]
MGQRYGLEIRAASGADAAGIAALMTDLGLGKVEPGDLTGRLDAALRAGGGVLIALEWGPPSGLIALQTVQDMMAARPAGFVSTLAVAPDARRRGIGRLLVKAASRSARLAGCDRLLLAPDPAAPGLAAFAAATGFLPENGLLARPLLRRGAAAD